MKNLTLVLVVLGLTLCSGCRKRSKQDSNPATTDVLAGYHFVGTKQLANNPVAAKLKELWALPESKRLTEQTLQKLAHAPKTLFGEKVGSDQDQRGAALLRPMLDDLLREESFLQVHGAADQTADWTLLVRLPADRLKLWHSNTTELMRTWTLGIPTANAFEGLPVWEVKRSTAPNLVRWARAGQWFALGVGSNSVPALDEALRRINSGAGRPVQNVADAWVEVELNLTRLTKPLDLSAELKWPRTRLSIIGRGENLRTTGRIILSESMTGPITPWQIPTNIITDPLASFTAVRGAAPLLQQFKLLKDLDLGAPPNQFFLWSQSHVAFQVFCAWPSPDAPNTLQRVADRAPAVLGTNMQQRGLAQISWQPTNQQVAWKGLPVITPFLRLAHDAGKEFIVGGLFPPVPLTNPPPAELLSQLAPTNLLCYDWEITQTRLSHGQVMAQLFAIVADKPQFTTNTAGLPWLMAIAPRLGNTVTEITADSPSQWSLTRKSHLGLSAVELIALTRWLESTNFPRLSFDLPPARFRRPP